MKTRRLLVPMLFAAGLCAAGPAWPQADPLTDPLPRALGERADRRLDRVEQTLREMRAILYQGRDTGRAVVVQPAETQGQVETLTGRVGDLEATLRTINGQIDALGAEVAQIRRDTASGTAAAQAQASANAALVARIEALERRVTEQAAVAADPSRAFDNAMQLYVDGQHAAAATAFNAYLTANPDSAQAPEARYYLGESLYRQADYAAAASAYIGAIRGWPATAWGPSATVKLAQSLIELRKNEDACGVLAEFNTRYPRATAALKATATTARTRARCG